MELPFTEMGTTGEGSGVGRLSGAQVVVGHVHVRHFLNMQMEMLNSNWIYGSGVYGPNQGQKHNIGAKAS